MILSPLVVVSENGGDGRRNGVGYIKKSSLQRERENI